LNNVENLVSNLKADGISYEDQQILVTGGAGFLGSWIIDTLLKLDAKVICIDNFSSGLPRNIDHNFGNNNFKFIEHDMSHPIYLKENIQIIFHLASRASPFEFSKFPIQILKANTLGTWIALGIAKKKKARLVYSSTSEVYGNPDPKFVPTPESYNGNVSPIGPRSCYDEAKRAGESFVKAYILQANLDARIIRIFNTYGPRMRSGNIYGRVIPNFIEQALTQNNITVFGQGSQTRSFTYVLDQIEGILRAGFIPEAYDKVINIGNNKEITILELAQKIKELTKSNSEITFHPLPIDDPIRRNPDITLARKILNWNPRTSLLEGLKIMINSYKIRNNY
jgi:UDP-glucuronate decarboxylase